MYQTPAVCDASVIFVRCGLASQRFHTCFRLARCSFTNLARSSMRACWDAQKLSLFCARSYMPAFASMLTGLLAVLTDSSDQSL